MEATPTSSRQVDAREKPQGRAKARSPEFLRSAFDALSAHSAILDEQGAIIEVNAACMRFAAENDYERDQRRTAKNYSWRAAPSWKEVQQRSP
jgi:PAS domain-containing protein